MTVLEKIRQIRETTRLHMTLIDPDKQSPASAGRIARIAERVGSDAIVIGGSSSLTRLQVSMTVERRSSRAGRRCRLLSEPAELALTAFPGPGADAGGTLPAHGPD